MKKLNILKKLKFIAPLPIVAMPLFSCSSNIELKSRINRIQYQEITGSDKAATVHKAIDSIYLEQTEDNGDVSVRRLKLLNDCTIDTNIDLSIKGTIIQQELQMKDLDLSTSTNYKMSWSVDRNFAEFGGANTSWYIVYDGAKYWSAYSYVVNGQEIKERKVIKTITKSKQFVNYLRDTLLDRGSLLEGIDLGISGLGYIPTQYVLDENKMLSIGSIFHSDASGLLYDFYDYLNTKAGEGHNLSYKLGYGDRGTFSGEMTGNLDLDLLVKNVRDDIPDDYEEIIDWIIGNKSIGGQINFNLFAAWANNYIAQQEYIIKGKDLHIASGDGSSFNEMKADVDVYFGEEVSQTCDVTEAKVKDILENYNPVAG